jgi:acetolactate synthase-1/3 small subunit
MTKKHIIGMLVEDQPRVLTRIAGMLSRRGFNIDTITVGKTTRPGVSRIVLTITGDDGIMEQAEKQVNKLVDVFKVSEFRQEESIVSELCLVKVCIKSEHEKSELLKYADIYKVKISDITPGSVIFQVVGEPAKIDSFIGLVKKFGIKEVSRTGVTAISRGPKSMEDRNGRNNAKAIETIEEKSGRTQ